MSYCWPLLDSKARADALKTYGVVDLGLTGDEPISLEMARAHLELLVYGSPPASDLDFWLTNIGIPGARDWCESWLARSVAQHTLEVSTQGFPSGAIALPFGPVLSIVSVSYDDVDGAPQIVDVGDYVLDRTTAIAQARLAYGASWPVAQASANSVRVRYIAGYSLPDDSPQIAALPAGILIGMLLMLGHLKENREETIAVERVTIQEIPAGAKSFLERYRVRLSMA